jgi:hypothetical protein
MSVFNQGRKTVKVWSDNKIRKILSSFIFSAFMLSVPVYSSDSSFFLPFLDKSDYTVEWGIPKPAATILSPEAPANTPPGMSILAVYPSNGGLYEVFLCDKKALYRFETADFASFSGKKEVLKLPTGRNWLGFRAMTSRRGDRAEYLVMAAEHAAPGGDGTACGIHFFISKDGITWNHANRGNPAYHDHDMASLIWSPEHQRYVIFQITYEPQNRSHPEYRDHLGAKRRVLSLRTSADGREWSPSSDVGKKNPFRPASELFTPDSADSPDTEFYGIHVFPYAGKYLAAVQLYAPSPDIVNPNMDLSWKDRNRTSPLHGPHAYNELWVMPDILDMKTWSRPFREQDILADVSFDKIRHDPAVLNGKALFLSPRGSGSVPPTRLAGLYSKMNSIVRTKPFTAPAERLTLNATTLWNVKRHPSYRRQSYIMAEIVDENGKIMEGFGKEFCVIINTDRTDIPLEWNGVNTESLAGKRISLKLYFRDATIYSVQEAYTNR